MVILPRLRCPGCGKGMGPVKAKEVPPAEKFEDCLRRCPRCNIGASNAKNPAKVKYIYGEQPVRPAAPPKAEETNPDAPAPAPQKPEETNQEPPEPAKDK